MVGSSTIFSLKDTCEHYEYANSLWEQIDQKKQIRRSMLLLSALALKQNHPEYALELIASQNQSYVVARFLRLAIYTSMQNFQDAFDLIAMNLYADERRNPKRKPTIGKHLVIHTHTHIINHYIN